MGWREEGSKKVMTEGGIFLLNTLQILQVINYTITISMVYKIKIVLNLLILNQLHLRLTNAIIEMVDGKNPVIFDGKPKRSQCPASWAYSSWSL